MTSTPAGADSRAAPAADVLSVLKSHEFRQAYHQALDHAAHDPAAQLAIARSLVDTHFSLAEIPPSEPLHHGSVYFTEHPVEVHGHYKFLVPGDVHRELVPGPLFLLAPKAAAADGAVERLIDIKEFASAISAVEAVRLTLIPERVNGIISFIADAKQFYEHGDVAGAERSMGTALDHMNRAATDGLRTIKSDAERGKRSNEVAGTRRKLTVLRRTLLEEWEQREKR